MFLLLTRILRTLVYFRTYRAIKGTKQNLQLSRGGVIFNPEQVTIGDNVFIGPRFHIAAYKLEIGTNVMIGPNILIECSNHKYDKIGIPMYFYRDEKIRHPVKIGDDVWIGGNVTILPGVHIGDGCIVGAGSVVTRDLPQYTICVGNPCKPIKQRFEPELLKKHINLISK